MIDASNPRNPVLAGSYHTGGFPLDIAVSGNLACMLDASNGLQLFDVSNPASPALVGSWTTTNLAKRLTVAGKYAYVTHDAYYAKVGMSIIDISDPVSPTNVASYSVSFTNVSIVDIIYTVHAGSIRVAGNYAYLTYGGVGQRYEFGDHSFGGWDIIDISNPANAVRVAQQLDGDTLDIVLSGGYGYLTYYTQPYGYGYICGGGICTYSAPQTGGLKVYELSNPTNPVFKGAFETGVRHSALDVSGNYAYLLGGAPGLRVLNITDPTNLVLAAMLNIDGYGFTHSSDFGYLASGSEGLRIYCLDCPRLSAESHGGDVLLRWPQSATNFVLQTASALPASRWQTVAGTFQLTNGYNELLVPASGPAGFFRLREK